MGPLERHFALFCCLLAVQPMAGVKVINNGLAPPEIVHTPIESVKRTRLKRNA